jgi:hypothetical protein
LTFLRPLIALCFLLALSLTTTLSLALPSDQIIGIGPGVKELMVYADLKPTTEPTHIALKEVKFPLAVLEEDGDFLRVRLGGHQVWLDAGDVSINRATSYACEKNAFKPVIVASSQGAAAGCK